MKWLFLILLIACSKQPEIATDLPIQNYTNTETKKAEAPCDDAAKVKLDLEKKAQEKEPQIQLNGLDSGCSLDKK